MKSEEKEERRLSLPLYRAQEREDLPALSGNWEGKEWQNIPPLFVSCFRKEGSGHRPETLVKMMYSGNAVQVFFRVHDRYVRSVRTRLHDPVYKDSCVEVFLQPLSRLKGYFNFEFNCGGAMLCSFIEDPERTPAGLKKMTLMPETVARDILIFHSLPGIVEPEIQKEMTWLLEARIPLSVLEYFVGPLCAVKGSQWKGNFYKCADETSHPHWASWSPVSEKNFHRPQDFGIILLE